MLTLSAALIANRYELGVCIGQGGMGAVYRGIDRVTAQPVAIKRLHGEHGVRDAVRAERFRREGEALARLNHPNIVRMVELVHDAEQDFIVMELVTGGSLADLLAARESPLSLERVQDIAFDLCDALTRCHRLGIVHRDLKPSNVLLDERGSPRLTDFGAAHIQGERPLTQSSTPLGTTEYLSPEALRGDEVDARADVWAFGVVLFEMLTLQRPFGARNVAQTLHRITFSAPPDLEVLRPDCPKALVELVYGMLTKDRSQRVPSMRQVGAALDEVFQLRAVSSFALVPPGADTTDSARLELGDDATSRDWQPRARLFPTNLPVATSTFVGRKSELGELSALLESDSTRLVTMVGPGGMGKTRLALELGQRLVRVAARARPEARPEWLIDGVFWVQLAALAVSDLVLSAIAEGQLRAPARRRRGAQ
jgi:serine/threonine protein kinase